MKKYKMQIPMDAWCWASVEAATIEEAVELFKERAFTLQDIDEDTIEVTQDEYFYENIDDGLVYEE